MQHEFDVEIEYDGQCYRVEGSYNVSFIDDSFSHEFGVHHCGHEEVDDIDIQYASFLDQDGGEHEVHVDSYMKKALIEKLQNILV